MKFRTKHIYRMLIGAWLGLGLSVHAQKVPGPEESSAKPALSESPQFGVRFSYQLLFPSKNYVNAHNFSLFEAGHHLGYGAFVNLPADPSVQFSPYFGLEHVFWPKSLGYSPDCTQDSFPTFMGVHDSLPGRDFRMFNLVFEPAFKFYVAKMGVFLRVQPYFAYNIQTKVEDYTNTCGVPIQRQFLDWTDTPLRKMSKFNIGFGLGVVKEVELRRGSGIALEPGFKFMVSRLLMAKEPDPSETSFSLYPWGFYLNLSFFR